MSPERVPLSAGRTALADGSLVRDYRLTFLGMGGMSVVYKGEREGRIYLLKEVSSSQPTELLALTGEKGLLERLDHPGIVHFYNLFEQAGFYYLVVEFIDGPTLEKLQNQAHPFDEAQVRDWALQLCDIFCYLHSQKPPIIYRDLKPANIMLQDGKIRLIDFGIARVHKEDRNQDTESLGTFLTASPEHYGGAQTDARSDVFTVGATLYDLLSGGRERSTLPSLRPPLRQFNPTLSEDLERTVKKTLELKPEARFQTMDELRLALGGGQTAEPPAILKPARTLLPNLVILGVVLTLLGAVVYGWNRYQFQPPPLEDTGLVGDVFGYRKEGPQGFVVTLGEDIGLFRVNSQARADKVSSRLNKLYHEQCPTCGLMKLEAKGFRLGHFKDHPLKDEVVLFYSHLDGDIYRSPEILTVLDAKQASQIGAKSTRYAAGYWRDLVRDVVELSRGRTAEATPLGPELNNELLRVRHKMGDGARVANLKLVLSELGNDRVERLKTAFENVPSDFKCEADEFPPLDLPPNSGLIPLKG